MWSQINFGVFRKHFKRRHIMRTLFAVIAVCVAQAYAYLPVGPQVKSPSKVVGGANAAVGQFPHQISLVSTGWFGDSHICGGSLIGPRTVLTAAHCCDGSTASSLKVKYDGINRTKLKTTNLVTTVLVHPNWNTNTIDSDYCILRLTTPVVESATVKIIPIASSTPATGVKATLSGWGKTSGSTSTLPTILQCVVMDILSATECNAKWADVNPVTATMICAQNPKASGCNGDSGGPLIVNGCLVGVVSWGANGCPADTTVRPTVYADPTSPKAKDFIASNTV